MNNPTTTLNFLLHKLYGKSPKFETIDVTGSAHQPEVTVKLTLPDDSVFRHTSTSTKHAKRILSQIALNHMNGVTITAEEYHD